MNSRPINPVNWRFSTLLKLGPEDVHELACKAVGTLTAHRLVLGRCLWVMDQSKGYRRHGCSSAIHYACAKLGMQDRVARECRRVARALRCLPNLTRSAEQGRLDWGKLREIVRKATPRTEKFWLRLAKSCSYREIEALIQWTPYGSIPGEVDTEDNAYTSELRCSAKPELFVLLDHARRVMSIEKDKAVTTADVLETALASFMSTQPFDEEVLRKAREAADKDLQAANARRLPVVLEARELAAKMGLLEDEGVGGEVGDDDVESEFESEFGDHFKADSSQAPETPLWEPDEEQSRTGSLDAIGPETEAVNLEIPAFERSGRPARVAGQAETLDPSTFEHLESVLETTDVSLPDEPGRPARTIETVYKISEPSSEPSPQAVFQDGQPSSQHPHQPATRTPWQNPRLHFNQNARFATKSQRAELLRRDGWSCTTPGCPHTVWLHLHHLHEYSQGGATAPDNLICLCSACHSNVHDGILKIVETETGDLLYTDAQGNRLDRQADLELAGWLDYHLGWRGQELDSHQARLHRGEWSVFVA